MASAVDIITAASLSYRQLDHWTRCGYIKTRTNKKGSGHPRDYSDAEMAVAVRMARLVNRGFTPKAAAQIARVTPGRVHLGQGVWLEVKEAS